MLKFENQISLILSQIIVIFLEMGSNDSLQKIDLFLNQMFLVLSKGSLKRLILNLVFSFLMMTLQ